MHDKKKYINKLAVCWAFFPLVTIIYMLGFCPNSTVTHAQETFIFELTHSHTNLHNSVEEAGVTEVIYAFDRDQGAVDGWALSSGRVSII